MCCPILIYLCSFKGGGVFLYRVLCLVNEDTVYIIGSSMLFFLYYYY